MNSPMTAPITASVTATFAPVMTNGNAAGSCTFQNICQRDARRLRASSSSSGGVDCRPAAVSITTGKNATSQAIASLDSMPVPSQTSTIGASATLGTDCSAISSGENIQLRIFELEIATAIGIPMPSASKKP